MNRKALADKIIVLGVDGMDPALTKRFMEMGESLTPKNSWNGALP